MDGPTIEYRRTLVQILQRDLPQIKPHVVTTQAETVLDDLLLNVASEMELDVERSQYLISDDASEEDAYSVLAAVDSWMSTASYAVSWVYSPQSPLPIGLSGWSPRVAKRLHHFSQVSHHILSKLRDDLGANSYAVIVSFPFGISVSLSWDNHFPAEVPCSRI